MSSVDIVALLSRWNLVDRVPCHMCFIIPTPHNCCFLRPSMSQDFSRVCSSIFWQSDCVTFWDISFKKCLFDAQSINKRLHPRENSSRMRPRRAADACCGYFVKDDASAPPALPTLLERKAPPIRNDCDLGDPNNVCLSFLLSASSSLAYCE